RARAAHRADGDERHELVDGGRPDAGEPDREDLGAVRRRRHEPARGAWGACPPEAPMAVILPPPWRSRCPARSAARSTGPLGRYLQFSGRNDAGWETPAAAGIREQAARGLTEDGETSRGCVS